VFADTDVEAGNGRRRLSQVDYCNRANRDSFPGPRRHAARLAATFEVSGGPAGGSAPTADRMRPGFFPLIHPFIRVERTHLQRVLPNLGRVDRFSNDVAPVVDKNGHQQGGFGAPVDPGVISAL
jgi:hypothetical protein